MKFVGPDPVLMARDKDGRIHLLHNRCPHRGNQVCEKHRGNARSITCNCLGWAFGNDGSLRGHPFPGGYANDKRQTTNDKRQTTNDKRQTTNDKRQTTNDKRKRLGLGRVAGYKGFVFGSMAEQGLRTGHATNDLCSRGVWQRYRALMEAQAPMAEAAFTQFLYHEVQLHAGVHHRLQRLRAKALIELELELELEFDHGFNGPGQAGCAGAAGIG